jgi:hypothetical protein
MATPIHLAGRLLKTNQIILEDQGIDVILGMGWMNRHNAVLDIAARTVHLESPIINLGSCNFHHQPL